MSTRMDRREPSAPPRRAWKIWVALLGLGLVVWFFIAWLALDRHILDAAGESVGAAFALLLVVSLIGALRGSRSG
jgi:hypothetical protein